MKDRVVTPLFSGNRLLFWPLAILVVTTAGLLPVVWRPASLPDVAALAGMELALASLLVVAWDPVRFHGAGRLLLGLLALGLGARFLAALVIFPCAVYALTGRLERYRDPVMEPHEARGALNLEGTRLTYLDDDGELLWEVDASELRAVGEYTIDSWGTDHFLCFLRELDGSWLEASFNAEGRGPALAHLGEVLGTAFHPALCDSTTFRSHVLWPPEVAGEELLAPGAQPKGRVTRGLGALGMYGSPSHVSSSLLERLRERSAA